MPLVGLRSLMDTGTPEGGRLCDGAGRGGVAASAGRIRAHRHARVQSGVTESGRRTLHDLIGETYGSVKAGEVWRGGIEEIAGGTGPR